MEFQIDLDILFDFGTQMVRALRAVVEHEKAAQKNHTVGSSDVSLLEGIKLIVKLAVDDDEVVNVW